MLMMLLQSPPAGVRGPRNGPPAYIYCADLPLPDKSGGAPLPSQPPVPYIVPAVREGGYGDKLASE